jgi:hypothetical protein
MKEPGFSFIPVVSARARDGENGLTSFGDTVDLGEGEPWGVVPTLDKLHPCGFEMLAMAAPRAEKLDKPAEVMCQPALALYYGETKQRPYMMVGVVMVYVVYVVCGRYSRYQQYVGKYVFH